MSQTQGGRLSHIATPQPVTRHKDIIGGLRRHRPVRPGRPTRPAPNRQGTPTLRSCADAVRGHPGRPGRPTRRRPDSLADNGPERGCQGLPDGLESPALKFVAARVRAGLCVEARTDRGATGWMVLNFWPTDERSPAGPVVRFHRLCQPETCRVRSACKAFLRDLTAHRWCAAWRETPILSPISAHVQPRARRTQAASSDAWRSPASTAARSAVKVSTSAFPTFALLNRFIVVNLRRVPRFVKALSWANANFSAACGVTSTRPECRGCQGSDLRLG